MQYEQFDRLVRQLVGEVPAEYLDGIAAIDVSPRALPHPTSADVYTLGECIPIHGDLDEVVSRVVLYHGSFLALAEQDEDFSWREEAWETLTHELRHHLEWRANADALERYDWAAEQNFARQEGRAFDPLFHIAGEEVAEHIYRVDDDFFCDVLVRTRPAQHTLTWHGRQYGIDVPTQPLPLFISLDSLDEPPPGEVVVVFRRRPRLRDLLRVSTPPSCARAIARRRPATPSQQ